jgi:hypothetical protein
MIRLTTLLLEKEDKSTLNVLFVGDSQTYGANSYAKQLLRLPNIDGTITSKPNADLSTIYTMVQDNMSEKYDVVSILCGDIDSQNKNPDAIIEQLKQIYLFAKKFNCILVAITTPSKEFAKEPDKYPSADSLARWIKNQTISDITINLFDLDNVDFKKDGIILDNDINSIIAKDWYIDVLNIVDSKLDKVPSDSEESDMKKIQLDLAKLGYLGSSKDAITQIQKKNKLSVTGKLDQKTKDAIKHELETSNKPIKLASLLPKRKSITSNIAIVNDVIKFFVDKGLSVAGAAGIAGNLAVESGFKTYNPGDNGTSNGLAQWHNERWTGPNGFEAWCTEQGLDPWSVNGQLEFLWWELNKYFSGLITVLSDENITPYDAAYKFAAKFERPSHISSERMTNAETYFDGYSESI